MAGLPAHTGYAFVGFPNLHNDIYPSINASVTPALQQPGKVVLITGAGRGIGRGIALQYAYAGVARLILCARTGKELDEVESRIHEIDDNVEVRKEVVDVTNVEEVLALAEKIKKGKDGGRLDVLVNNAGTSCPWVPITDVDAKDWWNTLEVNLRGPFNFLHAFLPLLTATAEKYKTGVNVVNVTSIGAHIVSPGASAYQISKLAVLRLCESVDTEFGKKGVQSVGVHPGGVLTSLSEQEESLRPSKSLLYVFGMDFANTSNSAQRHARTLRRFHRLAHGAGAQVVECAVRECDVGCGCFGGYGEGDCRGE
jgi:NAD(P)-dependent dehydrogenase (short-subunit alcohol dehydrogenase family)